MLKLEIIRSAHKDMRELAIRFGKISEISYDKLIAKLDKLNEAELNDLLSWIVGIKSHEYYLLKRVYNMPPKPECWDNYSALGITNLREQQLMETAGNNFRKAWRNYVKAAKPDANQTGAS